MTPEDTGNRMALEAGRGDGGDAGSDRAGASLGMVEFIGSDRIYRWWLGRVKGLRDIKGRVTEKLLVLPWGLREYLLRIPNDDWGEGNPLEVLDDDGEEGVGSVFRPPKEVLDEMFGPRPEEWDLPPDLWTFAAGREGFLNKRLLALVRDSEPAASGAPTGWRSRAGWVVNGKVADMFRKRFGDRIQEALGRHAEDYDKLIREWEGAVEKYENEVMPKRREKEKELVGQLWGSIGVIEERIKKWGDLAGLVGDLLAVSPHMKNEPVVVRADDNQVEIHLPIKLVVPGERGNETSFSIGVVDESQLKRQAKSAYGRLKGANILPAMVMRITDIDLKLGGTSTVTFSLVGRGLNGERVVHEQLADLNVVSRQFVEQEIESGGLDALRLLALGTLTIADFNRNAVAKLRDAFPGVLVNPEHITAAMVTALGVIKDREAELSKGGVYAEVNALLDKIAQGSRLNEVFNDIIAVGRLVLYLDYLLSLGPADQMASLLLSGNLPSFGHYAAAVRMLVAGKLEGFAQLLAEETGVADLLRLTGQETGNYESLPLLEGGQEERRLPVGVDGQPVVLSRKAVAIFNPGGQTMPLGKLLRKAGLLDTAVVLRVMQGEAVEGFDPVNNPMHQLVENLLKDMELDLRYLIYRAEGMVRCSESRNQALREAVDDMLPEVGEGERERAREDFGDIYGLGDGRGPRDGIEEEEDELEKR